MWDVIFKTILIIFGAAIAVTLVIDYLDYQKAKELALKEKAKNTNKAITKAIIDNIKLGNVNVIDIGLYDTLNNKQVTLELETKKVSSDIYKGQILFN